MEYDDVEWVRGTASRCPKCNGNNLNWGDTEDEDESRGYNFTCPDCGCYGTEWHNMNYDQHAIHGINNEEGEDKQEGAVYDR